MALEIGWSLVSPETQNPLWKSQSRGGPELSSVMTARLQQWHLGVDLQSGDLWQLVGLIVGGRLGSLENLTGTCRTLSCIREKSSVFGHRGRRRDKGTEAEESVELMEV